MKKTHQPKESSKEKEYLDGWKRARADLENLQKRMIGDMASQREKIKRDTIESLVPLADNFRSLVDHAPDSNDPWIQGVVHVARQLDQVLQELGVEVIHKTGVPFDPNIHEAVEEVEGEGEKGNVASIIQAGYKTGSMTIRPAKVKVIK